MDLRYVVHGDDFILAGTDESLEWIQQNMHESFLMKVVGKLGRDQEVSKELRVLNRILRWTPQGITYEADPRHVELPIKEFSPTGGSVKTAGTKVVDSEFDEPLQGHEVRRFRGGAARANYLAQDRPEISYATK